jgi:hypothetical protein
MKQEYMWVAEGEVAIHIPERRQAKGMGLIRAD